MLFGIGFGLLIERAQICFTSAFRDMWITGRTVMAKAIIFGMAASAIGIFSYVQLGMAPKIMWAGLMRRLAGYYLALASCWPAAVRPAGCTGRWRAFTTGGLGWATSSAQRCSPVLGRYRRPLATHWQKVNLLNAFGPFGGLLATYLLLLIALLLVIAGDIFPPPRRSDREGERMKNIIPDYRGYGRRTLPVSGGRYRRQCLPCKRRILEWSATVRSRSITFRLMQGTTATRCWIFNRMAQPFAI